MFFLNYYCASTRARNAAIHRSTQTRMKNSILVLHRPYLSVQLPRSTFGARKCLSSKSDYFYLKVVIIFDTSHLLGRVHWRKPPLGYCPTLLTNQVEAFSYVLNQLLRCEVIMLSFVQSSPMKWRLCKSYLLLLLLLRGGMSLQLRRPPLQRPHADPQDVCVNAISCFPSWPLVWLVCIMFWQNWVSR